MDKMLSLNDKFEEKMAQPRYNKHAIIMGPYLAAEDPTNPIPIADRASKGADKFKSDYSSLRKVVTDLMLLWGDLIKHCGPCADDDGRSNLEAQQEDIQEIAIRIAGR